jgi:hypothetical protein
MASTARTNLGRRLRLAVAVAAVATVLTTATASTAPRSQFPAFLLDRGGDTSFEAPDPGPRLSVGTGTDDHHRRPRRVRYPAPGHQRPRPDRGPHENPSGGRGSG